MYNLGDSFRIDTSKGIMNSDSVIQGKKYRISILTERLIRLEYSQTGEFKNDITELVWNRNFEKPEFTLRQDKNFLEIETSYFHLVYEKEKPFESNKITPTKNLKVELKNTDRVWYCGHPEAKNYQSPGISLDSSKQKSKSLYSIDGFASIDDSKSYILTEGGAIEASNNNEIDIYLFMYNNDFKEALKDYFHLTGNPSLVPRYSLGNWWHKNEAYNDATLKSLVNEFQENEIPLSVLLLDQKWHLDKYDKYSNLQTGFTFNQENFIKPESMIGYLHSKGIRIGLAINPRQGIYPYEQYYNKILEYIKPDESGVIPLNVYNPKFIDVYLKILIHPLDNLKVDFFWNDYDNYNDLNTLWLINHYHFYDMKRNFDRRPMILSRNSLVAAHRYPILYAGKTTVNWSSLKEIPFFNSSSANIGVSFWCHNIGGYYKGIEDNELYTRYVQLGTFSPILKFGSDQGDYYKREPWKWSIKTYTIVKDYLQLRHKLIPYLYTEAYNYHKNGIPFVQPIYYKNKEMYDDSLYRNEYYFGSQLFVAPIVNKKDYVMNRVVHKVFIPSGMWYDFVTGKKFPGDKEYVSFVKDEDYPVFARSGAIIPLGINKNLNDTTPPTDMEIHIFPGQNNSYNLYEDDGVSDLYRKGFYLLTNIDYNYMPSNYTVIIRSIEGKKGIVPDFRNYVIRFRNTKEADEVIAYFNNEPIEYKKYIDNDDFVVEVKDVSTVGQLTINCKGKDIEIDAVRIINEDIKDIISDLQIQTVLKEEIDSILFSDIPIKKKRIAIRKLGRKGLEKKFIRLFLRLLEYISQV